MMLRIVFMLLIFIGLLNQAHAQNMTPGADPGGNTAFGTGTKYYVSWSDGNDSDSGLTEALAWKSIAKVNTGPTGGDFLPGSTILFKRGDTWTSTNLEIDRSGNAANPIIYGSYGSGARPIINNVDSDLIHNQSWIILDRLHFFDGDVVRIRRSNNITVQYSEISKRDRTCIKAYDDSTNILIQYNIIHNCGRYSDGFGGLKQSGVNGEGIYIGASLSNDTNDQSHTITLRGNEIYHTGDEGINVKQNSHDVIIEDNIVHTMVNNLNLSGGITLERGTGTGHIIRRNVVHSTNAQAGIMTANNVRVVNNLVYNNTQIGIRVREGGTIYHNTTYDNDENSITRDSDGTGIIKNNIGPNTTDNIATSAGLFVNAAGGNFQLAGGSAALNLGAVVGGTTTDILGVGRPQGANTDYGAYETTTAAVPSAPLTPSIVSSVAGVNMTLAWAASATGTPTSYKVYWATAPNTYTNNQSAGLSLTNTVNGLTLGTVYYFNIAALNATGESAKSVTVSGLATVPLAGQPTRLMLLRSAR